MKEFKLENSDKIKTGFTTPENYFDNFSEQLTQRLNIPAPKVIPFYKKRTTAYMLVAAIFVIALMIPILNTSSAVTTNQELDETSLENYLSYQTNVNQYDLINVLDDSDINQISSPIALEDKTIEDMLVDNANLEHLIIE